MGKTWSLVLVMLFAAISVTAQSDRHLNEWYAGYNHAYFHDELPIDVRITRNLHDDRFVAQTEYTNGFFHIEINPRFNQAESIERETLLHEQCHILMAVEKTEEFNQHGQKWQACMMSLAKQGAFEGLW